MENETCPNCNGSGDENHIDCGGSGKKSDGSECNCANGKIVCTTCSGLGTVLVERDKPWEDTTDEDN